MVQDKERLERLKGYLRNYVETITQRSKSGMYICPLCGSGTGAHHTGALSIQKDGLRWKCFSCNQGGDIFDLYAAINRCDLSEATKGIIGLYGSAEAQIPPVQPKKTQAAAPERRQDFREPIERYETAMPGSKGEEYLISRGLKTDTLRRFRLGYDAAGHWVTIPYDPRGSYYGRRSVDPDPARKHEKLKGVRVPLFNPGALYAGDVCFVVESPLCAISIEQEGGRAVALSGSKGGKNLLTDQLRKKPTKAALVLCLDNDKTGRETTEALGKELEEMGVFCVNGTSAIMGDVQDEKNAAYRKDPNEVLQKDGDAFLRQAVTETAEEARRQMHMTAKAADEDRQQHTGAGMVDSFLQVVQSRKYEPIPTGIQDIDKAIGGGFIRQQLILLGAAPGAGKTALAQWIFEGMARRGVSCVFLNLEMSREQMLARSLARITAQNGQKVKATEILQGYSWTEEQRIAVLGAAEEYKADIAPFMIYNPDGVTANLDSILRYIEAEAARAEKQEEPAPCVVLDYLQIVGGEPREDATAVIKRAVSELKSYAIRHNTVVFVIIAHNRESNRTGDVSMESGRDTSALEYSADLQLALTFTGCLKRPGQDAKAKNELTAQEKRFITLKVTKGRFGGADAEVDLHFDGETMSYTQLDKTGREEITRFGKGTVRTI